MCPPDRQARFSGFAQFLDHSARASFVRSTLDRDPDLKDHSFLSESRPTIVFEGLTAVQRDRIRSALGGLGRWFDDVQFRPMS